MSADDTAEFVPEKGNTLLLSPSFNASSDRACGELLTAENPDRTAVLMVSNVSSADDCLQHWMTHGDGWPATIGIVTAGEFTHSTRVRQLEPSLNADIAVEHVSNPGDLTGWGIEITELLKDWHDEGLEIAACFDSITVLLQYASAERAYEFLYVLTRQFATADIVSHFHMDPSAHADETVYMVRSLFDAVIEFEGDGDEPVHAHPERLD